MTPEQAKPVSERIASKSVRTESGCLEWQGRLNQHGYGVIWVGSRSDGSRRASFVHREAYALAHGAIPSGYLVLHSCDNRRCAAAEHLRIGSHQDNMDDMKSRGRSIRGRTRVRKLTPGQTREVFLSEGPQRLTAERFGISQSLVSKIKLKKLVRMQEASYGG